MKLTSYTCNVCGRPKGESSDWFVASIWQGDFCIQRWDDGEAEEEATSHLCGLECAVKAMIGAMRHTPPIYTTEELTGEKA